MSLFRNKKNKSLNYPQFPLLSRALLLVLALSLHVSVHLLFSASFTNVNYFLTFYLLFLVTNPFNMTCPWTG